MIEQNGRVELLDGDGAWIECRPASCHRCDEGRGCGAGIIARLFAGRPLHLRVVNDLGVRPGDRVVMGMDEHGLLAAAWRLYGIPVLALLAGAAAGAALAGAGPVQDLATLSGALSGLAVGLGAARVGQGRAPRPVLLRRSLSETD